MIQKFILFITFFSCNYLLAQEGKLFEVEYDAKKQTVQTLGYTIAKCSNTSIDNTWRDWVKARNGKLALLNKYEANEITFKNSPEKYKVNLNLVDEGNDSLTVITTLLDGNGMYLNSSSMDYAEVYEKLKDLSFEMRKGCYRYELTQANEYMMRLTKQSIDAQTTKANLMKKMLKNQNEFLKLETKKNLEAQKIATIDSQLSFEEDEKKLNKLYNQKAKSETKYNTYDAKSSKLNQAINAANIEMEQLDLTLDGVNKTIKAQNELIQTFKSKLNNIYR